MIVMGDGSHVISNVLTRNTGGSHRLLAGPRAQLFIGPKALRIQFASSTSPPHQHIHFAPELS
ncbi:hypothetical protein ACRALDRAFT_204986 [Sodiomyces alcalophilus JCM 7366]|uniref:uncharacterized protein n=1 Tax=Sodiomyces alcalophilus JCM 7366 TaxID=591952 RepID=UPI0039B4E82B